VFTPGQVLRIVSLSSSSFIGLLLLLCSGPSRGPGSHPRRPVGGVNSKAEAAFRDPFIHALIVPDGEVSAESLIRLYISQPALCFSRRVVMVHTADEAAREAIIGWSHSDYLHEENLVQGGQRHFARGEDALAVAAFRATHDTDPDNWTPTFWIAMIERIKQQIQKDAAQATSDANLGIKGK